jgi:hypothetical protein
MTRELDAKVDKLVFGRNRFAEQRTSGGITLPVELQIPEYSTCAAADYEVLKHVREKWGRQRMKKFVMALDDIWDARIGDKHESPGQWACMYEPGDYSKAALLALGETID